MKRLVTYVLLALLSLGVASVSIAQEGGAGAAPAASETPQHGKAKKHAKKHHKKGKKSKKKAAAPAEETK